MRKYIQVMAVLIFVISGIIIFNTHNLVKDREREPERNVYESERYSLNKEIILEFQPKEFNIFSINLYLTDMQENEAGYLAFEIRNIDEETIYKQRIFLSDVKNDEWTEVYLDKNIRVSSDEKYVCVLQAKECKEYPTILTVREEAYPMEGVCSYFDGMKMQHNVAVSFNYLVEFTGYMKIAVMFVIFAWCGGIVLFCNKEKIVITEKSYTYVYRVLLLLLVAWITYLHLYDLREIPLRLHIDEVATGYDAFCISNYGVDRFLTSFPVYFPNYGQGQSALCIYISALFMRMFGTNIITLRMPAVIFSYLTLIYGFKISKEVCKSKSYSLLFVWLFGMVPYFTMASRWSLDCNLMLGMSTVFLYYLYIAIKKKSYRSYIIAGILGGIVLYTYCLSWVVMPLFLLLSLSYVAYIKQINVKQLFCLGVPMFVVALPLIIFQFVNIFNLEDIRIGSLTIGQIPVYRSESFYISDYFINLFEAAKNVLSHDGLPYNAFSAHYTLLRISVPFVILGLISMFIKFLQMIRKKENHMIVFVFIWFLSMGLLAGTLDYPNINRMNAIFFVLLLFLVEGIHFVYSTGKRRWRQILLSLCAIIFVAEHLLWSGYYYDEYANDLNRQYLSYGTMDSLVAYMDNELEEDVLKQKTYFMGEYAADDLALYYYLAKEVPPMEAELFGRGDKEYNNFVFVKENCEFQYDCSYVIPDICRKNLLAIENAGFNMIRLGEYYYCYYK